MSGPSPKSTALKRLQGNPGRRKLNDEPSYKPAMLRVPRHLDDEAKREWRRVVRELYDAGLISRVDRGALAAYCQAWSRWVQAEKAMRGQPLTLATDKGYEYPNPLLGIANSALEQMRKWATEFGMTPSARRRVTAKEPEQSDPFEEYVRARLGADKRGSERSRRGARDE